MVFQFGAAGRGFPQGVGLVMVRCDWLKAWVLSLLAMAAALAVPAAATAQTQAQIPAQTEAQPRPAAAAPEIAPPVANSDATNSQATNSLSGYVLGANDRLRLIVFGEENLSGEFQIDSSGNVSLPLIGETKASGLDLRAFGRAIEARLADGYLRDPKVSVEVLSARPFYILGEVQRAGQYPYVSGMTAPNAVATAGGFAPLADQTRVLIKRAGQASETEFPLDAQTEIAPGDTIRVIKGAFFILGEVNAPGEYPYTQGLSVLQAVATAKGFTYRANRSRAFIQRAGELVEKSYKISPSLTLRPGDTLRVGERLF